MIHVHHWARAVGSIAVLAICATVAGCRQHGSQWGSDADEFDDSFAVLEFAAEYSEAFVSGDADAVAALLTEDFVALVPDKDPIVGRAAAREAIAADLQGMKVHSLNFATREVEVRNNWAWAWGISQASMTPDDYESAIKLQGQFLWILQRGPHGDWLIARDCSHGTESESNPSRRPAP